MLSVKVSVSVHLVPGFFMLLLCWAMASLFFDSSSCGWLWGRVSMCVVRMVVTLWVLFLIWLFRDLIMMFVVRVSLVVVVRDSVGFVMTWPLIWVSCGLLGVIMLAGCDNVVCIVLGVGIC